MTMTNVELCKMWKSVIEAKGSWEEVVSTYREATGSKAKDGSLKSSITNRLSAIRKELSNRGISDEKIVEALPVLSRRQNDLEEVIAYLIDVGQMTKETTE